MQDLVEGTGVQLGVIDEHQRPALEDLSRRISGLRRADPDYEAELTWWTGQVVYPEGVPADALPPAHRTVATEREFPAGTAGGGRDAPDRAALLLLSTTTDTRLDWLRCGEALSGVLLLCADEGLASCPVTHLTAYGHRRKRARTLRRSTWAGPVSRWQVQRSATGTDAMTASTCCPHPPHPVFPQFAQVTGYHMTILLGTRSRGMRIVDDQARVWDSAQAL
ncbi:hypothetical protein RDE2_25200 [Rhodococcus sp. RDE2]|nr:hypothetical protein RDE2_25200 [Rhodococcus sp. RDE2]